MASGKNRIGRTVRGDVLLALSLALMQTGCVTVDPGGPSQVAECDALIRDYAKIRPDAVNADEWTDRAWARALKRWDRNGDGKIDLDEWRAAAPDSPAFRASPAYQYWLKSAQQSFEQLDRGRKGYLDRADIGRDEVGVFRDHDRNHDGWVTRDECTLVISHPHLLTS